MKVEIYDTHHDNIRAALPHVRQLSTNVLLDTVTLSERYAIPDVTLRAIKRTIRQRDYASQWLLCAIRSIFPAGLPWTGPTGYWHIAFAVLKNRELAYCYFGTPTVATGIKCPRAILSLIVPRPCRNMAAMESYDQDSRFIFDGGNIAVTLQKAEAVDPLPTPPKFRLISDVQENFNCPFPDRAPIREAIANTDTCKKVERQDGATIYVPAA